MTQTHPSPVDPQTHPDPVDNPVDGPTPIGDVLPLLAKACPNCGAQPGQLCTTTAGGEPMRTQTHRARPRPRKQRAPAASRPRTTEARGPAMRAAALGKEVAKLVKAAGARSMHVRRGQRRDGSWETATSIPGWLDEVIWGPGCGVLFRELKATRGVLTPAQRTVIDQLRAAGANAGCWWPSDLEDGTIARELGLES